MIDRKNKIVTSPCYMVDATVSEIAAGADKTIKALISLVK
jgi:enhancing lycopene biosynthesis protein 2